MIQMCRTDSVLITGENGTAVSSMEIIKVS